jgi:hypothetical protein
MKKITGKTARSLLQSKKVGEQFAIFHGPSYSNVRRTQQAVVQLLEKDYIRFVRRYSHDSHNGHGRPITDYEYHYEVLCLPTGQ